jgi:hypothetical protein
MGTGGNNTPMVAQESEPPMLLDIQRVGDIRVYSEPVQALQARMGTGGNSTPMLAIPIQDGREIEKNQNGLGVAEAGSPAYTLDQTGAQSVAYSIREDAKANNFSATELDHANSLSALRPSPQSHHAQMFIAETIEPTVFQPGTMFRLGGGVWEGTVPTLRAEAKRGDNEPHIQIHHGEPTMAVRRLTPLECERLMGWPDHHTRYKADGTEQADTHRESHIKSSLFFFFCFSSPCLFLVMLLLFLCFVWFFLVSRCLPWLGWRQRLFLNNFLHITTHIANSNYF